MHREEDMAESAACATELACMTKVAQTATQESSQATDRGWTASNALPAHRCEEEMVVASGMNKAQGMARPEGIVVESGNETEKDLAVDRERDMACGVAPMLDGHDRDRRGVGMTAVDGRETGRPQSTRTSALRGREPRQQVSGHIQEKGASRIDYSSPVRILRRPAGELEGDRATHRLDAIVEAAGNAGAGEQSRAEEIEKGLGSLHWACKWSVDTRLTRSARATTSIAQRLAQER